MFKAGDKVMVRGLTGVLPHGAYGFPHKSWEKGEVMGDDGKNYNVQFEIRGTLFTWWVEGKHIQTCVLSPFEQKVYDYINQELNNG